MSHHSHVLWIARRERTLRVRRGEHEALLSPWETKTIGDLTVGNDGVGTLSPCHHPACEDYGSHLNATGFVRRPAP